MTMAHIERSKTHIFPVPLGRKEADTAVSDDRYERVLACSSTLKHRRFNAHLDSPGHRSVRESWIEVLAANGRGIRPNTDIRGRCDPDTNRDLGEPHITAASSRGLVTR